jgi:hypothetical protein
MWKPAVRPPSPAMVVAMIALFAALGGTGYAASELTKSPNAAAAKTKKKSKPADAQDLAQIKSFFKANRASLVGSPGAQGSAGPQGPQGSQGPAGPQGPVNAFSGSIEGSVTITTATRPGDKVGHLNLQPGSYVIFAKAWIENQSATTATTAGCELDAGTASDLDYLKVEPAYENAFRGAVALNVAHTFTSAGTAQLSCFTGGGVTVSANNVVVTAIQVASLTANALIAG